MALFDVGTRVRLISRQANDDLDSELVGKAGLISVVHNRHNPLPGHFPDPPLSPEYLASLPTPDLLQSYEVDFDGYPINPQRVYEP